MSLESEFGEIRRQLDNVNELQEFALAFQKVYLSYNDKNKTADIHSPLALSEDQLGKVKTAIFINWLNTLKDVSKDDTELLEQATGLKSGTSVNVQISCIVSRGIECQVNVGFTIKYCPESEVKIKVIINSYNEQTNS